MESSVTGKNLKAFLFLPAAGLLLSCGCAKKMTARDDAWIQVNSSHVSIGVRSEPSFKQAPIATLKKGTEIERTDIKGKWSKIRFKNRAGDTVVGWINNSAIDADGGNRKPKPGRPKSKPKRVSRIQLSPM